MQRDIPQVPWVAFVSLPQRRHIGTGHEIVLQGFHWESHAGVHDPAERSKKTWYRVLRDNAAAIKSAGFSWVWFPPASDSLAPEGYIPRRWYQFNTPYGSEAELRAAIQAIEPIKALGDVVLNHRVGAHTPGADFADPPFPDNQAAIVRGDNSGAGTGNWDTGEHHPAGRDLDHTNPDVRATVKKYLARLKALGFKGWRYDLVKGYHPRYVGEYNDATEPEFSVGEFFDGDRGKITWWLDNTGGKSSAFDFATRFLLYDACTRDEFGGLRSHNGGRVVPGGLIGYWPSRAVTFVDNHDTEYRRDRDHQYENSCVRHFPGKTVEMAYAYTLTHPGVPCVFWSHFFDWGGQTRQRLETLMKVRNGMGLHSRSGVDIKEARKGLYAAIVDGKVAVKLGSQPWSPGHDWQLAVDGEKFAVWARGR